MSKKFFRSSYKRRVSGYSQPKSKRSHVYSREEANRLRQRVFLVIFFLILIYLVYLLFYSDYFRVKHLNIQSESEEISKTEIEAVIKESLGKNNFLIFPGNNYFFAKLNKIQETFNNNDILIEIEAEKKFPNTLDITAKEKIGRIIWVSSEKFYVLEIDGILSTYLATGDFVNIGLPMVYDLSNTKFDLNDQLVSQQLVDLILEIYTDFNTYELPAIELDYFKVDSPQANYVKIVTKQGFEIHVNYLMDLEKQINKLKQSLAAGKINLNNINYINLRVENQVIYK